MPVKHAFVNPKADGADPAETRPSDWNADHVGSGELDYAEFTAPVSITATSAATAQAIVTGSPIAYDGSAVIMVEAFVPAARPGGTAGQQLNLELYEGSTPIGIIAFSRTPASGSDDKPVHGFRRLTPAAATITYSIKGWVSAGTGVVSAGAARGRSGGDAGARASGQVLVTVGGTSAGESEGRAYPVRARLAHGRSEGRAEARLKARRFRSGTVDPSDAPAADVSGGAEELVGVASTVTADTESFGEGGSG